VTILMNDAICKLMYRRSGRKPAREVAGSVLAVLFCASLNASGFAQAAKKHQFVAQPVKAYVLSKAGENAVKGLHELEFLPDSGWTYHEGDVVNGETESQDVSSWTKAKAPLTVGKGTAWFRQWIEVPSTLHGYDIEGASLSFSFGVSSHGAVSKAIFIDGHQVAVGEDLQRVVIFAKLHPGAKALVAVKVDQTVDVKQVAGGDFRIEYAPGRPSPRDFEIESTSAARLLPVLVADPVELAAKETQLETALASVDFSTLKNGNQKGFDKSLTAAQLALDPLRATMRSASIDLVGESHIDLAWLWRAQETIDVVRRTFGTSLQLMREYPSYKYAQSSAIDAQWMQDGFPAIFKEMQARTKEGRWEPVGGMWVEPDLIMPDGESIVRQLLIGKRYFQNAFGYDVHVGWNPDSFGFPAQLPQIYKKSGVDFFMTHKLAWSDTNVLPLKLFWWEAPDGSRLLTYFPYEYGKVIDPTHIIQNLADAKNLAPGEKETMQMYGVGDHGGGATREVLNEGLYWMQPDMVYPELKYTTAIDFFNDVVSKVSQPSESEAWNYKVLALGKLSLPAVPAGQISVPLWKDELYLEFHRGTYTTQTQQKKNMRDSEEWMLNAEKFASLAWLDGRPYPTDQLNDAWRKVLFNQFHDLAAGSGVAQIYRDAEADYDAVRRSTTVITDGALNELLKPVRTEGAPGSTPIAIINPLAWSRSDIVEADLQLKHAVVNGISIHDSEGRELASQVISSDPALRKYRVLLQPVEVPSLGYEIVHETDAATHASSDLVVHGTSIENSLLRVDINPTTGCIDHLVLKKTNFDSIAKGGCGNQLQAFADNPKQYDAWNIDPGTLDHIQLLGNPVSVKVIEQGSLRAAIQIVHRWQSSTFIQTVTVYSGLQRIDISSDIDWHETHILLKAAFPLAAAGPMATYENQYGTIQRPTTRGNSLDESKFEVPALRWADLGDSAHGLSLLNNSKYGYDALGNVLRLSLLRSSVYPDPEADRGHQQFVFSLYPHDGSWQQAMTIRRGYEFNYALSALQVASHAGAQPATKSFISIDDDGVVMTAVKKAEDSKSLILRLYEWKGESNSARIHLPGIPQAAEEVNMMENPTGTRFALHDRSIVVPFHPFEIETLRIQYKSAAEPGGGH